MLSIYWRTPEGTRNLVETPFATETQLERYLYDNQDILGGDISIIHRQIQTGARQGIPDMIGVDQDARICILELKNVEADESILPQALGYAIWAETNPDSIKAIWLESKNVPEDVEIDWGDLEIRIILVAPAFKQNVQHMAGKLGYPIDLVQVRRYCLESDEMLLVEFLEQSRAPKPGVTKVRGDWDWAYYEEEHGKEATAEFREAVESLARFVKRKGWSLPYNLNKYYTGFKLGNKVVFDVGWWGAQSWKVRAKLAEGTGADLSGVLWQYRGYQRAFHQAIFDPKQAMASAKDVGELEALLEQAYKRVAGV